MSLSATYFGSSGWLIEFGAFRVLVDPWLKGKLVFPPGKWLFEGTLKNEFPVPSPINLLLLTQGLADHAHPPSLDLLPRSVKAIGSTSASKVCKRLGFKDVFDISPGQTMKYEGLTIEATAGAPVPSIENGYVLTHDEGSVYLEPHGFLDANVAPRKLDAVITPVIDLKLPLLGSFIKGKSVLPRIVEVFKPSTIFSSTTGGEANFSGAINKLIKAEGTFQEASYSLQQDISMIEPIPGHHYVLKTKL